MKVYAIKRKNVESYLHPMGAGLPSFSRGKEVMPHLWASTEGVLAGLARASQRSADYDLDDLEVVAFDLIPVRKTLI